MPASGPTDVDRLGALAAQHWGLDVASVQPLPGETDRNVALTGHDGARFLMKVRHRPGQRDLDDLALQDAVLRHVARSPAAGLVPPPIATSSGDTIVWMDDGAVARLFGWLPGATWAATHPHLPADRRALGDLVARIDRALAGLEHPHGGRVLRWDLQRALELVGVVDELDSAMRTFAREAFAVFESLRPALDRLPRRLIHNDANDHNVIVSGEGTPTGLIDVGDVVLAPRVCGLAVACTYAMFGHDDPVGAVLPLVAGYHAQWPLLPEEVALIEPLVRTRLAMSACLAALQRAEQPDNDYLDVSQADVRATAARLGAEPGELAHLRLRDTCGYAASPTARAVVAWLESADAQPADVCRLEGARAVELGEGSRLAAAWRATEDPARRTDALVDEIGTSVGVGGYLEDRDIYRTPGYAAVAGGDPRTVHLALDVWLPEGEPVRTPFDAVVEQVEDLANRLDYGPVVLLRHETGDRTPFWTLWGHLSRASHARLAPGQRLSAGDVVAEVGPYPENGDWPTHLHLQLLTTLLGRGTDLPGVVAPADVDVWRSICPDPALLLRSPAAEGAPALLPDVTAGPKVEGRDRLLTRRGKHVSPALSLAYADPLHVVRGEGAYLYDDAGRAWLDLVNNVCHVGHSHPRVVAALAGQAAVLNTNTRYLYDALSDYAERLLATFPDPLSVLFLTNSGSEANDLALRLARTHTGGREVAVLEHAYHGNLSSLVEISPYKFERSGGNGRPDHVRVCELPDPYRGRFGADGPAYADDVAVQLTTTQRPAAFIAESLPGCAGQVELAPGYLEAAFAHARAAGAVCISDEVQVGFGRVGSHFWGFQTQGVVPDIVTLGKPIGNGHPLGAVVTSPQVARSFVTGMEYFNTYGGNPVSCRVGLAVLDVIRTERLQAHAHESGVRLVERLRALGERHPLVGDVRGRGLYVGVELVRDRDSKEHATEEARLVKEAVKRRGILVSTDGPKDNVLKVKPPMVVSAGDLDRFVVALDDSLAEVGGGAL